MQQCISSDLLPELLLLALCVLAGLIVYCPSTVQRFKEFNDNAMLLQPNNTRLFICPVSYVSCPYRNRLVASLLPQQRCGAQSATNRQQLELANFSNISKWTNVDAVGVMKAVSKVSRSLKYLERSHSRSSSTSSSALACKFDGPSNNDEGQSPVIMGSHNSPQVVQQRQALKDILQQTVSR
jgi:hypothetical protein